jgi:hypothetical protein
MTLCLSSIAQSATEPFGTPTTAASQPPREAPMPLSPGTLEKISKMTPIFNGKTLDGWKFSARGTNSNPDIASAWVVKDGALHSVGAGRSVLYTANDYANYRIIFTMRHVSGGPPAKKDHRACVLLYCYAPFDGEKAMDALGGIQFQVPNGGNWDYRPGKNKGGGPNFTKVAHPKFDEREWSQVEILVNTNGTVRMAVAQPPGTKAFEVLDFNDPTAGRKGPFGLQMHNDLLVDEYKDIRIETDPKDDQLVTLEK